MKPGADDGRASLPRLGATAFGGATQSAVLDDVWRLDMRLDNVTLAGNWTAVKFSSTSASSSGSAARAARLAWALAAALPAACLL